MPFFRRANKKKTVKRRGARRPRAKRGGKSLVTKAQLYRAIRRTVETKMATQSYSYTLFNSGITGSADFLLVLPPILQGLGQNERVGNSVKPLKVVIRGYINYETHVGYADYAARQIGARLFCFTDKSSRSYSNNIYNTQLLDLGGNSSTFSGSAMNWITPSNKATFNFFADKRFKFLKPYGLTNDNTTSTAGGTNQMVSMNGTLHHNFVITLTAKQLPSLFQYDQTDSVEYPVNFAPYMALGYCDLLNQSADTTITRLGMEWNATVYYEDA